MKNILFIFGILGTMSALAQQPTWIKCNGINTKLNLNIASQPENAGSTMTIGPTEKDSTTFNNIAIMPTALGMDYIVSTKSVPDLATFFLTLRIPSVNILYSEETISFEATLISYMRSSPLGGSAAIHGQINAIDSQTSLRCIAGVESH